MTFAETIEKKFKFNTWGIVLTDCGMKMCFVLKRNTERGKNRILTGWREIRE